jgi:hypothetical protein
VENRTSQCTFRVEIPVSNDTVINVGKVRCTGGGGQ